MAGDNIQLMRIVVTFEQYHDEDGDGVVVETNPTKNNEAITNLSNSSFITTAVISNAIEIVAHNNEAAIYIAKNYGDENLIKLLDTPTYNEDTHVH